MNIEELAFKDRKILANLNAVDLLNIIEFLQDDRRQCLEELSKTHNRSVEIQKECEKLKSILRGTTHYFDEEEHNKLKEEITNLSKDVDMWNAKYNDMFDENRMLKKQVENYKKLGFKHLQDKNNNLETQQKEFIEYLENEKDRLARECSQIYEDSLGKTRLVNEDIFNEVNTILSKYKVIIEDDK